MAHTTPPQHHTTTTPHHHNTTPPHHHNTTPPQHHTTTTPHHHTTTTPHHHNTTTVMSSQAVDLSFLPTPLAVAWVNRWTFSSSPPSPPPPPPPSHHQIFVSLRYRKRCGAWVFHCDAILFSSDLKISGEHFTYYTTLHHTTCTCTCTVGWNKSFTRKCCPLNLRFQTIQVLDSCYI